MGKKILGALVVGVVAVFGLSPFLFGSEQDEQLTLHSPLQLAPTVAGFLPEEAEAIFAQQRASLQRLADADKVRLSFDGIQVLTDNPGVLPPDVEGLPVRVLHPLPPSTIAGRSYTDALAVHERNQEWLRQLPDVEGVGLGTEGIHLFTENPGLIPPEVEGIPVQARPPMRRERIGGLPYEEAMAIYERQKEKLEHLSGVEMVGINANGVIVNTDNPAALPKTVEGLPVLSQSPFGLKAQTIQDTQPLPEQDCGPYAHWVPEIGRCRLNRAPSDSSALPKPRELLSPPPGVIILRPGGIQEQAESCPREFKEQVIHRWRFCLDPMHPEAIPPLMEPPIAGIPYEEALKIIERHREELMRIPGVGAVGLGADGINIETTQPERLPSAIEGLPIKPKAPFLRRRLSHTQNTQIRPLHGGVAIRDFKSGVATGLTLTGITLSQGVPWLVTSAHGLLDCSQNSPCPLGAPPTLNQCHNPTSYIVQPVAGQHAGTQRVVQPLSTAIEIVGFVQRWTPLNPGMASDDVAAAFLDNDTSPSNGLLRVDGKLELYNDFTGNEGLPVKDRPATVVTQLPPHIMPATVWHVSQNTDAPAGCTGGQPILALDQIEILSSTDDCFTYGDSRSPILDEFGNIIGILNYEVVGFGFCGGGGTRASTIRTTLGFEKWYKPGSSPAASSNPRSFGIYRPSAVSNNWVMDRGDGVVDSCGTGAYSDQCYTFGNSLFLPITGKWSTGGPVKIGIHYNGTGSESGAWYLDFNGDGVFTDCVVDRCYALGGVDFVPVVGDWNGDGRAKIGVFYTGGAVARARGMWTTTATASSRAVRSTAVASLAGWGIRAWRTIGTGMGRWRSGRSMLGPVSPTRMLDRGFWTGMATSTSMAVSLIAAISMPLADRETKLSLPIGEAVGQAR